MSENTNKPNTSKLLIIVVALSLLANAYLVVDKFVQKQATEEYIYELTQTQHSKDSLTTEFSQLYDDYSQLETDNDTLNAKLKAEQVKIIELLEKIKKTNINNANTINKYKKELASLRKVMRSFVVQLDSLNTMNKELIAENQQIKSHYQSEQGKNKELSEKNENLSNTVKKAAEIKALNIKVTGLTNKEKETAKTKKLNKFEVCCELSANELSDKGSRTIYLRISRPDGITLSKSPNNLFDYNGDQIVYSAKRRVEYTGKQTPFCLYWLNDEVLIEGKYTIDIFDMGKKIGYASIELK